jgi:hypothetical protein
MRKEDRPKRKRIVEVQSVGFAPRAGFPARSVLFIELALRAAVSPKSSYPCGNYMVTMWREIGAGRVSVPANPAPVEASILGRYRPLKSKMQ